MGQNMSENDSQILIYQTDDNSIKVDVHLEDESVWLTQAQMAMLFDKSNKTISEHIGNIFKEGELLENTVVRKFRITASDELRCLITVPGLASRIWGYSAIQNLLIEGKGIRLEFKLCRRGRK